MVAVCQYSGQKPIFHANTWPFLRLVAYGPVGFLRNSLKLRLGFGIICTVYFHLRSLTLSGANKLCRL